MTHLQVWAPFADRVEAEVDGTRHAMNRCEDRGWWTVEVPYVQPGVPYGFAVDGGEPRPDPRGVWLPDGVHALTRHYDAAKYHWHDAAWRGVPIRGSVVYELHVGTFTPEGTFAAAAERLDHLVELGVDIVELLPVHAYPGEHGWGYDVAAPYAVHEPYGGPDGLKAFVDACHGVGLGVALDVVYNHLGPDGAYLTAFGPYLTDTYRTPWGPAVNFDDRYSDEVRGYVLDNALMWLRDFHLDGLRLDAIHAIIDRSAVHILEELDRSVDELAAQTGRTKFLVAESDLNDPRVIRSRDSQGYGMDAQWSDDFHHALHVTLTGEAAGYYADFADGLPSLATALTDGFVYAGRFSPVRGRRHGRRAVLAAGWQLLGYLQNHDQIGNRAAGERSAQLLSPGLLRIAAALVLTSAFTPMLFMGEEWGASTPWQYFTDHRDAELAEAVRHGRRSEFAAFGWAPEDVPDPQDPDTFRRSKLNWSELHLDDHKRLFDWHRRLIALRRKHPDLASGELTAVSVHHDTGARWLVVVRGELAVVANLAKEAQTVPVPGSPVHVLLASEHGWVFRDGALELAAESVAVVRVR